MRVLRFFFGYLNLSEKVKRMYLFWCKENFIEYIFKNKLLLGKLFFYKNMRKNIIKFII